MHAVVFYQQLDIRLSTCAFRICKEKTLHTFFEIWGKQASTSQLCRNRQWWAWGSCWGEVKGVDNACVTEEGASEEDKAKNMPFVGVQCVARPASLVPWPATDSIPQHHHLARPHFGPLLPKTTPSPKPGALHLSSTRGPWAGCAASRRPGAGRARGGSRS